MTVSAWTDPELSRIVRIVLEEAQALSQAKAARKGIKPCAARPVDTSSSDNTGAKTRPRDGVKRLSVAQLKKIEDRVRERLDTETQPLDSPVDIDLDELQALFTEATDAAKKDSRDRGLPVTGL